jgi:GH15 family glucan-1,4-alpha-glucosidase
MEKLAGSDLADKTGRVIGTYRGYPVVLGNQTHHQYSMASSMIVTGQAYFTEFLLTIQNPVGISLKIQKKDAGLEFEPQDTGHFLLEAAQSYGRLEQTPVPFWIVIYQQELDYIQSGIEEDSGRLFIILETLCNLADAVGSYFP